MKPVEGTRKTIEADMVLLALGFLHPNIKKLLTNLSIKLNNKNNIKTNNQLTSRHKIFAAGDAVSGASLVVNAIASGRRAAREIDSFLRE